MTTTFIISSIITFLAMITIITIDERTINIQGKDHRQLFDNKYIKAVVRADILIALVFIFFLMLFGVAILLSVTGILPSYNHLYRWHEFLTSAIVSKLILGIVFGGLLAVWVAKNYRRPAESKLTLLEKIEGVALVFLLIAGMTTASLDELLRSVSLNDGKVNFQLAQPASRQSSGQEAQSVNTNKNDNGGNKESFFLGGFGPIKGMISTMKRDYGYIKAHNPGLADVLATHEAESGFSATNDIRPPLPVTTVAAVGIGADPQPDPQPVDPKLEAILNHGRMTQNFETSFKAFFECIAGSLERTADRRYLFNQIAEFRPLIGALYLNLIELEKLEGEDLSQADGLRKQEIQKRIADVVAEFNNLDANSVSAIASAFAEIKTFGADYHGVAVCSDLQIEDINLPDDLELASVSLRPYLATIYASLLYMDNQKLAAIRALNEDVEKFKKRFRGVTVSDAEFWYLQRALFDVIFMVEDFFITETQSPPPDILEAHLKNLKFYSNLIRQIDRRIPHEELYGNHVVGSSETLVETRFNRDPGFSFACPDDVADKDALGYDGGYLSLRQAGTFSYLYYTIQSIYVQRALSHPDFNDLFGKDAGHLAEVIANIDLNCSIEILDHPEIIVRQQRASFLHIYALYVEHLTEAKRNISTNHVAWLRDRLDLIDNAATLALEVLARNEATQQNRDELRNFKLDSVQAELRYNLRSLLRRNQSKMNRIQ
ncbi:hypothetical protein [Roseibium sp. MMSF_3544]|uniref:hypothetical protein n=1 Tax=unclassified Roseibium TaxID=2629323 RepID=UPI00273DA49B|nr:hypothetical protein [Roseibium sp. MMSF_3544]